jgi:competence protein ComEA
MSTQGGVDLNSAGEELLASVSGIGPVLARDIVQYRTEHGPFHRVEELDAVKGIGPAKLAKIAPHVVVGSAGADAASSGTALTRSAAGESVTGVASGSQGGVQQTMPGAPVGQTAAGSGAGTSAQQAPAQGLVAAPSRVVVQAPAQVQPATVLRTGARSTAVVMNGIVNINTAGEAELATLKRVGPVLAKRIVEYRQQHGAFASPAALQDVKGIGPKILEANLSRITVR